MNNVGHPKAAEHHATIRGYIADWTSDYSSGSRHKALRETVSEILAGGPAKARGFDVDALRWAITTRRDRWERLANAVGLPGVPDEMVLYRAAGSGTPGDVFVKDVAKAWSRAAGPDDLMTIRSHEAASWSWTSDTDFTRSKAVTYKRTFRLDETLVDQVLDDGRFVSSFAKEHEVVAIQAAANSQKVPVGDVTVRYGGRSYSFANRNEFFNVYGWPQP